MKLIQFNHYSFARRLECWLSQRLQTRFLPLNAPAGVISFTFDDAPRSSCQTGARILQEAGACGTWYVSGGLTGELHHGMPSHTLDDLIELMHQKHHVACHTWSHQSAYRQASLDFEDEILKNQTFLQSLGLKEQAFGRHFSFPKGEFDWRTHRIARQNFDSIRLIRPGVHLRQANLHALKANALYSASFQRERFLQRMQQAHAHKGWMIVYTHDVTHNPSPWGCTPELLAEVLVYAKNLGCQILPVSKAIEYFESFSSS